jgi:pimeloyl-ACP methyl ester carboxylesterase
LAISPQGSIEALRERQLSTDVQAPQSRFADLSGVLWHFHFYSETPLALVDGRERIYFEYFWNDFAADSTRSVPEGARQIYTAAYTRPGGMRAGFENFRAFERNA